MIGKDHNENPAKEKTMIQAIAETVITLGGIGASICLLGHVCETASRKYVKVGA